MTSTCGRSSTPLPLPSTKFDTLRAGLEQADKLGISFCAELALFDTYFPGLECDFFEQHPECWLLSRDQTQVLRIPCYAEPLAQEYRLNQIEELMKRGVEGFFLLQGAHIVGHGEMGPDELGFNPAVVRAYREQCSVNILSEPFDPAKLHKLNGDLFTGFLRRIRKLIGSDRKLIVGVQECGYGGYGGGGGMDLAVRNVGQGSAGKLSVEPSYRFDQNWREWIDHRIVDDLVVSATMGGAVERVCKSFKAELGSTRVYLPRKAYVTEDYLSEIKKELDIMQSGSLDGIWFRHLGALYDPQAPYPEIFKKHFNRR